MARQAPASNDRRVGWSVASALVAATTVAIAAVAVVGAESVFRVDG